MEENKEKQEEIIKEEKELKEEKSEVEENELQENTDVEETPQIENKEEINENIEHEIKDELNNSDEDTPNIEEKKFNNYSENKKRSNKHRWIIALIITTIIIAIAAIFSTVFALVNIPNTKIIKGVTVKGISVGNLTKEQASTKVENILKMQLSQDISLVYEEFETSINPEQIEFKYNIEKAIEDAYQIGRNGNILQNNYQILRAIISKQDVFPEYEYNNETLIGLINDIQTNLPGAMKEYSYYIEDGNLIITKGQEGLEIQQERLSSLIIEAIKKENKEEKKITIPVQIKQPAPIDIEKIHSEIYTEPKDAYYTKDPFVIYPHVDGVDFGVSMEEAKQIVEGQGETYTIKLKYTKPAFTKDKIGSEAFPDLLSTFSTKYDATNTNRSTNLKLASDKINGTVLMPGEEFSYNKVVGERTISAGYKDAKIFSNGKVIDGLGGGICQISSTLYNSVLRANLQITSRRNHQFVTSYLKAGLDATVVYGSTDFKFVNSRKYPIKIVSHVKNGVAKIDIYGIKEEIEYEVRIDPVVINYIPFTTEYIQDANLATGQQVVEQKGSNGVKVVTYKYLMLNGNTISKTTISNDTYNPMQKIVRVGAKSAAAAPSAETEATSAPEATEANTETAEP